MARCLTPRLIDYADSLNQLLNVAAAAQGMAMEGPQDHLT